MGGNEVYIVLDQVSPDKEKELSFGLRIVNKNGERLASASNNALIVTDKGSGLINIQGWYSIGGPTQRGSINASTEELLRRIGIKTEFQANASEIDIWLKGGTDIDRGKWNDAISGNKTMEKLMKADGTPTGEGENAFGDWLNGADETVKKQKMKSLFNSMWFDNKSLNRRSSINVTAEWVSWCGIKDNKYDKRLKDGKQVSVKVGGIYEKANTDVNLRVGSIRNSESEQRWALIPIGKPIMKINLAKESLNNETIQGTLEPMNDR